MTRQGTIGFYRMADRYRNWQERRQIISAVISEMKAEPLASFNLTEREEIFFRARSLKMIDKLARQTSNVKGYYSISAANPILYVIGLTALVIIFCAIGGACIYFNSRGDSRPYPILAACGTISVAAISWAVAGWISHRNAVRQNTINILFARFSQSTFTESLHRFHKTFGNDINNQIAPDTLKQLRESDNDEERKSANSAIYLLNYFEFIASGVLRGDLDERVVRENIRGLVIFYYDKCARIIKMANSSNKRAYEYLTKLRNHYREP
jgi:hypothetical protein